MSEFAVTVEDGDVALFTKVDNSDVLQRDGSCSSTRLSDLMHSLHANAAFDASTAVAVGKRARRCSLVLSRR